MKSNMELPKIERYSHTMRIVLKVFFWVAIIITCVSLVAAIIMFIIPSSKFVISEGNLEQNGFSLDGILRFNFSDVPQEASLKQLYLTIMLMSSFIGALIILVLKQLVLILKSVEEDRPFALENAKRILTIGVILILSSFLIPTFEFFVAREMVDTLQIQNVNIIYSINITLMFTGFLLLILSGIFSYGGYLQNEYDDTI